ncbi:MAG: Gfo/Idh/MocA family oxidoreductase [Nitrospinae bacterium]|nr:Gfo/Idh/MocA family oxidoreductase [Nitrospinota bacterium]MBL7019418.1 Gfo/Idh/MocA family oxidoreductase [Nitrospinaceae bacterium]
MQNNKIRIGIIGAGQNTKKIHLPKLQALPDVEILEVANRSIESAKVAADEFGVPIIREPWQEVATSADLDAIVIGTWPNLHCPATCLALESGKHVLCEARMAMNHTEARKMFDTSSDHPDLVAQLVPAPFSLHADTLMANRVGDLGRILFFHVDYQSLAVPQKTLHWRRNVKLSGMNIMTLGIIYESLLRWLPAAQWVKAEARIFNDTAIDPETGKPMKIEIPDYLSVQMSLQGGIPGTILISEIGSHASKPTVKIVGEKGTLILEFVPEGRLYFAHHDQTEEVPIPNNLRGSWKVEEEFVNAIRNKIPFTHTSFATGVEYMRFTEAVYRSYRNNGTRVPLSDT